MSSLREPLVKQWMANKCLFVVYCSTCTQFDWLFCGFSRFSSHSSQTQAPTISDSNVECLPYGLKCNQRRLNVWLFSMAVFIIFIVRNFSFVERSNPHFTHPAYPVSRWKWKMHCYRSIACKHSTNQMNSTREVRVAPIPNDALHLSLSNRNRALNKRKKRIEKSRRGEKATLTNL